MTHLTHTLGCSCNVELQLLPARRTCSTLHIGAVCQSTLWPAARVDFFVARQPSRWPESSFVTQPRSLARRHVEISTPNLPVWLRDLCIMRLRKVCTRQPPALHPRARTHALHGRADCGTPPASSPELLTLRAAPQDAARRRRARAPRASLFGPCGPIWACEQQYSHQRSTSVKKHPEHVFEPICDAYRRMGDEKKRSGERSISKYN